MEAQPGGLEIFRAPFGWTKSYKIQVKGHPLAENSKTITTGEDKESISDALKAESKIQSFWHIMTPDGKMHDVGKFDFSKHENLEVLAKYEAAKKRSVDEPSPHVKLMKKLAIADYEPASDAGNMRFFPNGRLMKSLIEQYVTDKVMEYGGLEVETPIMYDSHHPSMESYFHRFPARQYNINSEGKQLFLRFAACFGQFLMAKDFQISYKNLPLKLYEENKSLIEELVGKIGKPVLVETWKERFFYFVLKWEFNYVDNLGKASALSTDQIDVENGKRYNIEFIDENNKTQNPIILHNSPSGAIERVIYALLEKAAKDQKEGRKPILPLWLSPTQVRVIPVKPKFLEYCEKLADKISENDVRIDVDDRNETIGKSIRDAETEWIRYIIVIGEKEVSAITLSVRDRKTGNVKNLTIDELVKEIKEETKDSPFMRLNMSRRLSMRPQIMV